MDDTVYINTAQAQQQLYITIIFLAIFLGCRKLYSQIKRNLSQLNLVIVGAGPIGLTSALVAIKSGKIAKAIIYEEKGRNELINRSYQVSFDNNLVKFLQSVGVDFDHIEGCWQNGFFHTKVGVYVEYIIDVLQLRRSFIEIKFNKKVSCHLMNKYIFLYISFFKEGCIILPW